MNVYDFDGTIYRGDSSLDFYIYSLIQHPWLVILLPWQAFFVLACKVQLCSKERAKSVFFSFIRWIPNMPEHLERFWDSHEQKIEKWYLNQQQKEDIIISASPSFLLQPVCKRLTINNLIASEIDINSGKFISKNCYGAEKCERFRERFPSETIDAFYSDSLSDRPMMQMARNAYIVSLRKSQKVVLYPYNNHSI